MGKTIIEKIISEHCGKEVSAGEFVVANVDVTAVQDGTGPLTIQEIQNYHYKKVREGNEIKEVEAKVDDHTVDEFLYAIMYFCGDTIWDPSMIRSG